MAEEAGETRPGHMTRLRAPYVDAAGLEARAARWMEQLEPYTRHRFERGILGEKPMLVVMDMQRFFLDEDSPASLPAGQAILPRIKDLVEAFRAHRHPVIFTCHRDRPNDTKGPMARWWRRLMLPDDPLTALHPDLACGPGETLLIKHQYSAFFETRLEVLMRQLRVETCVIAGVMTHLCCESTARDAFMRGFNVVAIVDGMVTLNEALHLSALQSLVHGFAVPALSRDVILGLGE
ncbi:MAG: isochorismatase family protein [Planctomycetota bacterium]|jgi:nicotinamidase-related amidase